MDRLLFFIGEKMSHYFENDNNLKSEIEEFNVSIRNKTFFFNTDNGVFSKKELDFGTKLLIENVLNENIQGNILDLGCGYGPIGIVLKKILNVHVTMVDINKRAVHLTKMNAKKNDVLVNVYESDGFKNVNDSFDFVISNPPVRVGKKKMYELILDAKKHLKQDGMLYIVLRKEQGALSFIKDMSVYYCVNVIDKQKGFFIISLKSN